MGKILVKFDENFFDFFYLIIPSNDQMRITFKMKMKILIAINDEEEVKK